MAALPFSQAAAPYFASIGCDIVGVHSFTQSRHLLKRSSCPMRSRNSETLLLLPLLPIFFVGIFPMLLFGLLGFLGVSLFGILLVCVGLADGLNANSNFNQQVIVHGYAKSTDRSIHATDLHSAMRFALVVDMIGAALVAVGLCGFFWFG
jgi:hypothetical protein